jgi:hypothetical protein
MLPNFEHASAWKSYSGSGLACTPRQNSVSHRRVKPSSQAKNFDHWLIRQLSMLAQSPRADEDQSAPPVATVIAGDPKSQNGEIIAERLSSFLDTITLELHRSPAHYPGIFTPYENALRDASDVLPSTSCSVRFFVG